MTETRTERPTGAITKTGISRAARPPVWVGFLAGVVAACAMTAAMLVLRLGAAVATYPELIGDALAANVPVGLFNITIDTLEEAAKPALFAVLTAIMVLVGGLIGAWYARRMLRPARGAWWGVLLPALQIGGAAWLFTMLVISPLVGADIGGAALPEANAYLVGGLGLFTLYGFGLAGMTATLRRAFAPVTPETHAGRRHLLHTAAIGTSVFAAGAAALLVRRFAFPDRPTAETLLALESPARDRAREIATAARAAAGSTPDPAFTLAAGRLPDEVTASDRHYVISKNFRDPVVNREGWKITLDGLVATPLTVTYDDLRVLPAVTYLRTMECISNRVGGNLIGTGQWTGVPLRLLLERAGVQPDAFKVKFVGADDYSTALPLAAALDPATILAYQLNGEPLPSRHGYPARLIIPSRYGMKNPKWITQITAVTEDYHGFWEQQAWTDVSIPETTSRIDTPRRAAPVGVPTAIAGLAYAGDRGIRRVEVSTDGGKTWADAALQPALGPYTWVFWAYPWTSPVAGSYTLVCRATDGNGNVQILDRRAPIPDGATGLHRVSVTAV